MTELELHTEFLAFAEQLLRAGLKFDLNMVTFPS